MLKKRIIPCLDIRDGRTVKGVNFIGLKDAGDPVALASRYVEEGADELVFLDITATLERRKAFAGLVEKISFEINIPFTVGGGIDSIEDVRLLLYSGADKVSVNSAAVRDPDMITSIANQFGNQCVVVAIDARLVEGRWMIYVDGGNTPTGIEATEWAKRAENAGAGEILLTSMSHDGTRNGFSLNILDDVCNTVKIPVIASGGAGTKEHFLDLFSNTGCSAALAASIFHFSEIPIPELKEYLRTNKIAVR